MLDTVARSRRLGTPSTYFLFLMLRFLSIASLASAFAFSPVHARTCGEASWYGPGFHGRLTANGERFNQQALTAAHKSLPFGTRLRVVNQDNGKAVTIGVNDDGPAIPGRIIDLSAGAFARIASKSQGLVRVCYTKA